MREIDFIQRPKKIGGVNISDRLIVTFDKSNNGDDAVLLVSREIFDTMIETRLEVIAEFTGDAAIATYNYLTLR